MRSILLSTCAGLLLLLAMGGGFALAQKTELAGVVNVNTATSEQLQLLPGIGPARARAILEYRKRSGGFKSVDDLKQIDGIGDHAMSKIRSHCATQGKTTAQLKEL